MPPKNQPQRMFRRGITRNASGAGFSRGLLRVSPGCSRRSSRHRPQMPGYEVSVFVSGEKAPDIQGCVFLYGHPGLQFALAGKVHIFRQRQAQAGKQSGGVFLWYAAVMPVVSSWIISRAA